MTDENTPPVEGEVTAEVETPPVEEVAPSVDFEATISALGQTITERDATIAKLTSQLSTAQEVNSTLLRQIGTVAAPDAHQEVERTSITVNDILYGKD